MADQANRYKRWLAWITKYLTTTYLYPSFLVLNLVISSMDPLIPTLSQENPKSGSSCCCSVDTSMSNCLKVYHNRMYAMLRWSTSIFLTKHFDFVSCCYHIYGSNIAHMLFTCWGGTFFTCKTTGNNVYDPSRLIYFLFPLPWMTPWSLFSSMLIWVCRTILVMI